MEIWYYERKMKQFEGEETGAESRHYEVVKIIEDESAAFATDRHEIAGQNLTEQEAKAKVIELTELSAAGGGNA
jgi:hypothetical protein